MYLKKSVKEEIPNDAIIVSSAEALEVLDARIKEEKWRDVWPIRFGSQILGLAACLPAAALLMRYRRRLQLRNYGMYTITLPLSIVPGYAATFGHLFYVKSNVILQTECPVCLFTRAALIQTLTASFMPITSGSIMSLYYAHNFGTHVLPKRDGILTYSKQFLKDCKKLNKPSSGFIVGTLAGNLILVFILVKMELEAMTKLNEKLFREEYEKAKQLYIAEKKRRKYDV